MLHYLYSQIFTREIPDELCLGFVMLGCNVHCPDCHSQHTWDINCKGQGIPMTTAVLDETIQKQSWVSCILFFGGEWDMPYLENLCLHIRKNYQYKLALYSGRNFDFFSKTMIVRLLNFIKIGPYVKTLGGIDYPSTNQRLYALDEGKIVEDMTPKFWRTNIR